MGDCLGDPTHKQSTESGSHVFKCARGWFMKLGFIILVANDPEDSEKSRIQVRDGGPRQPRVPKSQPALPPPRICRHPKSCAEKIYGGGSSQARGIWGWRGVGGRAGRPETIGRLRPARPLAPRRQASMRPTPNTGVTCPPRTPRRVEICSYVRSLCCSNIA